MGKISKIDLIGVPWPANLLKCSCQTGKMQPGDELVIFLEDKAVKDSLVLILNAMHDLAFGVSEDGSCYQITIMKNEPRQQR